MSAQKRFFRMNQVVFKEGDRSDCMYLLTKGTMAIRKQKGNGYIELGKIFSGEVVGELAFFDRLPRSASAVAISEVEALEISYESLDEIYVRIPDYLKTIMAAVAERLRKADDAIRRLQHRVVREGEGSGPAKDNDADAAAIIAASSQINTNTKTPPAVSTKDGDNPKKSEKPGGSKD